MKRRKKAQLQMLLSLVAILIILIVVVIVIVSLVKGAGSKKKLESLTLTPSFAEQELDVNKDYIFTFAMSPDTAKVGDDEIDYIIDAGNATFESYGEGKAILHTYSAGPVTVCIRSKGKEKVESNYLYYNIRDIAAEQAAAQAEADARAQAEADAQALQEAKAAAEEAAAKPTYVKTNDNVRMRKSPSTESDENIIKKCAIGEVYLRLETVDDWSRLQYEEGEAYIKSEFLDSISDEEAQTYLAAHGKSTEGAEADALAAADVVAAAQEKSKEEEAAKAALEAAQAEARKQAESGAVDPTLAAQQQAAAELAAQQAALEAAQQQAPAAPAAPVAPAGGVPVVCKDGTAMFTPAQVQYFHGLWDYTGQYEEMVSHHSIGELRTLCQNAGIN